MSSFEPPASAAVARAPRSGRSVALIGIDGAGKSTVARAVVDRLPFPAAYLYMGVNLDASTVMLPTTRAVMTLKRRRGRQPDMTANRAIDDRPVGTLAMVRRLVRMTNWLAEEAYRAVLARRLQRRGSVVVFDRHFFCDYYASAIAPTSAKRPLDVRLHGYVLDQWYPRPDLVLMLDAPSDVLVARRPEVIPDTVAQRREEYLDLARVFPAFEVITVDRPLEHVVEDVVDRIVAFVGHDTATDPLTTIAAAKTDDRSVELGVDGHGGIEMETAPAGGS